MPEGLLPGNTPGISPNARVIPASARKANLPKLPSSQLERAVGEEGSIFHLTLDTTDTLPTLVEFGFAVQVIVIYADADKVYVSYDGDASTNKGGYDAFCPAGAAIALPAQDARKIGLASTVATPTSNIEIHAYSGTAALLAAGLA